jgi:hypothetical protein
MADLIRDTNFAATIQTSVDGFQKALAKRWRERVASDINAAVYDFPKKFRRLDDSHERRGGQWDYTDPINRMHFAYGNCRFVRWAEGDQSSDLSSVTCPGSTNENGGRSYTETADRSGRTVRIPDTIPCGMGSVLAEVDGWAWQEAHELFLAVPKFDAHDQDALDRANTALLRIGDRLGLQDNGGDRGFGFGSNGDLTALSYKLGESSSSDATWWEGWTGLTATYLKDGFFSSVVPTVSNQGALAGAASNLVAGRAAVIDKTRASVLELIDGAAQALDAKTESKTSYVTSWKIVKAFGDALSVVGIFNKVAGGAGSVVKLVGSIGDLLNPAGAQLEYSSSIETAMQQLWERVGDVKRELTGREDEYTQAAGRLRDAVYGLHSFNLEMYDLTENSATGSGDHDGYHVNVAMVMEVADTCFECAEIYEEQLIPLLGDVESAESHLADEAGDHTAGDTNLIELITEFRGYLTTACGRLYTAGEEVKAAAEAYVATDEEQRSIFDKTMAEWDNGSAPAQAAEWAQDTDRNTYEEAGTLQPGHADPGAAKYATELSGG